MHRLIIIGPLTVWVMASVGGVVLCRGLFVQYQIEAGSLSSWLLHILPFLNAAVLIRFGFWCLPHLRQEASVQKHKAKNWVMAFTSVSIVMLIVALMGFIISSIKVREKNLEHRKARQHLE